LEKEYICLEQEWFKRLFVMDCLVETRSDMFVCLFFLIENYIYMSYKKDNQLRKVYNYIVSNCPKAKKAMKRLSLLVDYVKG
jgi:hypothetical protein